MSRGQGVSRLKLLQAASSSVPVPVPWALGRGLCYSSQSGFFETLSPGNMAAYWNSSHKCLQFLFLVPFTFFSFHRLSLPFLYSRCPSPSWPSCSETMILFLHLSGIGPDDRFHSRDYSECLPGSFGTNVSTTIRSPTLCCHKSSVSVTASFHVISSAHTTEESREMVPGEKPVIG